MRIIKKRGQESVGISFGVIFSIIIIIAIIAVAIYVIVYFLNLNKCMQSGLFFEDLQEEIDKAWQAQFYSSTFEGTLPQKGFSKTNVGKVCFGSMSQTPVSPEDRAIYQKFKSDYSVDSSHNVFIYPPDSVCSSLFSTKSEYLNPNIKFFCVDVINGKVSVKLDKKTSEVLVTLSK